MLQAGCAQRPASGPSRSSISAHRALRSGSRCEGIRVGRIGDQIRQPGPRATARLLPSASPRSRAAANTCPTSRSTGGIGGPGVDARAERSRIPRRAGELHSVLQEHGELGNGPFSGPTFIRTFGAICVTRPPITSTVSVGHARDPSCAFCAWRRRCAADARSSSPWNR